MKFSAAILPFLGLAISASASRVNNERGCWSHLPSTAMVDSESLHPATAKYCASLDGKVLERFGGLEYVIISAPRTDGKGNLDVQIAMSPSTRAWRMTEEYCNWLFAEVWKGCEKNPDNELPSYAGGFARDTHHEITATYSVMRE